MYLTDHKYIITYRNTQRKTKVRPILFALRGLKWQKKVTSKLTWMNFLQNLEVSFNQESLPIIYHNFHHKCLVRPKSKFPNWQISQSISHKANLLQRDKIHLVDRKYNITYQNVRAETKVRSLFTPYIT